MFYNASGRARRKGLEFNLTIDDIEIPTHCPVLGVELIKGIREQAPSIHRIDSSKGYIKGNIAIVSFRANKLINDATLREMELCYQFQKNHLKEAIP